MTQQPHTLKRLSESSQLPQVRLNHSGIMTLGFAYASFRIRIRGG